MTFDELLQELTRWIESDAAIAKAFIGKLERQPGFIAHRAEVLAEYAKMTPIDGTLTQLRQLADAYRAVMRRHSLPEEFIDDMALAN